MFDFLYNRDPESHKGDYGHALLVAGSYGKMGAAVLAARACLRSGVGLLTVHVPRCGAGIMQTAVPEAMLSIDDNEHCFSSLPLKMERYDAIAVGPGLGSDKSSQDAFGELLKKRMSLHSHMVIDADAINILAMHPESMHLVSDAVITPHVKEYGRLFGDADPQTMSDTHSVVIVKKAHRTTVFAPHCSPVVNDSGNAGMATAGSGDVLTGVMLGIVAQAKAYARRHDIEQYSLQTLAALAVNLHGKAGDLAARHRSQPALIASDIIDALLS